MPGLRRLAGLLLLLAASAGAQELRTGIAGNEAFPGVPVGQYTLGATFAGWTSADSSGRSDWYPITENTGRSWSASLIYVGDARTPGQSVKIIDGFWLLDSGLETSGGRILAGEVSWPPEEIPTTWPCWASLRYTPQQYPVATVDAVLGTAGDVQGTLSGCLDDIFWDPDQPLQNLPRVWGVISVGGPSVPERVLD